MWAADPGPVAAASTALRSAPANTFATTIDLATDSVNLIAAPSNCLVSGAAGYQWQSGMAFFFFFFFFFELLPTKLCAFHCHRPCCRLETMRLVAVVGGEPQPLELVGDDLFGALQAQLNALAISSADSADGVTGSEAPWRLMYCDTDGDMCTIASAASLQACASDAADADRWV